MLRTLRPEEPIPPVVSSWTDGWGLLTEGISSLAPTSGVWESANRGVWFPVYVPTVCVARRMWWANGATVSGTYNVEAGIYLDNGHKPGAKLITTGSVAQGTLNEIQFADITDTTLTPQLYWLFMSCSTTSATFMRTSIGSPPWDELIRFDQSSIGPGSAPATATPAESGNQNLYLLGIDTRAETAPTASSTVVNSGTASFSPSGSWADGDLMVAIAISADAGGGATAPTLPSGWTEVQSGSDFWDDGEASGTDYYLVAYKVKSGTGSVTFTNGSQVSVIALSGVHPTNPVASSAEAANTFGVTLPNARRDSCLVYLSMGAGASITPPSGMTELVDNDVSRRLGIAWQTTITGGSFTKTATYVTEPGLVDNTRAAVLMSVRGV